MKSFAFFKQISIFARKRNIYRAIMMKKWILILVFCAFSGKIQAQNASVEKSIYGLQIEALGILGHTEKRLSNTLALRAEAGLGGGLWFGAIYPKAGFALFPTFIAEPRWYYNLNGRERKAKRTDGNSANFFSLKTRYFADWFVITNYDELQINDIVSIIPSWGIRRNIGKHFDYEVGFGMGYFWELGKREGHLEREHGEAFNLHLRIGYRF